MLNKEEIECCKNEAKDYIEFMETAGDNAGWTRGLLWYIGQLETKTKELGKGQQSLIQSRRKWKNRYYKIKHKNKDLQKSVEQIFDDYQDIGRMAFDYSDKIEQLESDKQKLIEKLEEDNNIDTERVRHFEKAYRNAKKCGDTFYMKSHKRKIDTANARREVRKYILEILKKE